MGACLDSNSSISVQLELIDKSRGIQCVFCFVKCVSFTRRINTRAQLLSLFAQWQREEGGRMMKKMRVHKLSLSRLRAALTWWTASIFHLPCSLIRNDMNFPLSSATAMYFSRFLSSIPLRFPFQKLLIAECGRGADSRNTLSYRLKRFKQLTASPLCSVSHNLRDLLLFKHWWSWISQFTVEFSILIGRNHRHSYSSTVKKKKCDMMFSCKKRFI